MLLLDNNDSEEVEEAEHVDFKRVEEHLADGGSVFVTSKRSQKIAAPRDKSIIEAGIRRGILRLSISTV